MTTGLRQQPGSEQRIPGVARLYRTLESEEVARLVVRAVERRQRLVIRPLLLAATVRWAQWFPGSVRTLLLLTGAKRRPAEIENSTG